MQQKLPLQRLSPMKPDSKEFKKLQKKWYDILKKDGFEDAESDEAHLKFWSSQYFQINFEPTAFNARKEYFDFADKFLNEHKFLSLYEKQAWHYHCEGLSLREIVKEFTKLGIKTSKTPLQVKIFNLRKEMFAKYSIGIEK